MADKIFVIINEDECDLQEILYATADKQRAEKYIKYTREHLPNAHLDVKVFDERLYEGILSGALLYKATVDVSARRVIGLEEHPMLTDQDAIAHIGEVSYNADKTIASFLLWANNIYDACTQAGAIALKL